MDLINSMLATAAKFAPALGTAVLALAALAGINWILKRRWQDNPDAQFRFQLIMLALTFAGGLAVIIALPVNDETRGQLLSLIGILLSAAIALSSTTFIGNIMAGIMLRAVKSARPGDFITVAELTGRITEMGLLHTEVQTEFRDLVTVPNLYMVTQPMQVVRTSGTIISAEVSLGYDVSHADVSRILGEAASHAGLQDSFVHVRQLGDFSVTYRIAGLLQDVKSLISARSRLREAMLDALHAAGIEIVSPNFMNTRVIADKELFVPKPSRKVIKKHQTQAEDVVFDKAEEAASVEQIRKTIEVVDAELLVLEKEEGDEIILSKDRLKAKKLRLIEQLKSAEEERKAAELAEQSSAGK
ncbi:MAG: mechanosensitive ion channel [Gammaproteobacteria bacterium]|nr:mechanosensitive ion channel [Gammaproteobacteria bacterium]MDH3375154.1 mechanosensitive ion channel [Gammaproteobacteria bacterium]